MEDIIVTGIVLSESQYKEKDKLINIFTLEIGGISAILRGVSASTSKMKFAGQPFCFGRFELVKTNDFFVVKGVDLIDSFFDVTNDYDRYKYCNFMLETCKYIMKPNIISESLFLTVLKSLQAIVYNNVKLEQVICKFILTVLDIIGYRLNFETCDNCGMKFIGDIKFDDYAGTFRCANCSGGGIISKQLFTNLKILSSTDFDRISTIKITDSVLNQMLDLLLRDLKERLNTSFKSLNNW